MEVKRPKSVTWLAVGVLSLTGIQMLRLYGTIERWDYLNSLPTSVPPIYFGLSGLVWSAVGLALGLGLWRGKSWAVPFASYAAIAFTVYYWVDRLFLSIDPARKTNFPFSIGITVILLSIIYWILSRPRAQLFFGETNE